MARDVVQGYCKDSKCAHDVYTKQFIDNKVIPFLGGENAGNDKYIYDIRLIGTKLIFYYNDETSIAVDLSSLGGGGTVEGLTEEQIQAINEMFCLINDDGELSINYDDAILDVDFSIENGELIVEDNEENIEFTINENKEMEAIY